MSSSVLLGIIDEPFQQNHIDWSTNKIGGSPVSFFKVRKVTKTRMVWLITSLMTKHEKYMLFGYI
jgi:hypothetical protein